LAKLERFFIGTSLIVVRWGSGNAILATLVDWLNGSMTVGHQAIDGKKHDDGQNYTERRPIKDAMRDEEENDPGHSSDDDGEQTDD
jgi:hypothetical protein